MGFERNKSFSKDAGEIWEHLKENFIELSDVMPL